MQHASDHEQEGRYRITYTKTVTRPDAASEAIGGKLTDRRTIIDRTRDPRTIPARRTIRQSQPTRAWAQYDDEHTLDDAYREEATTFSGRSRTRMAGASNPGQFERHEEYSWETQSAQAKPKRLDRYWEVWGDEQDSFHDYMGTTGAGRGAIEEVDIVHSEQQSPSQDTADQPAS